jgi:hypothetical protein
MKDLFDAALSTVLIKCSDYFPLRSKESSHLSTLYFGHTRIARQKSTIFVNSVLSTTLKCFRVFFLKHFRLKGVRATYLTLEWARVAR